MRTKKSFINPQRGANAKRIAARLFTLIFFTFFVRTAALQAQICTDHKASGMSATGTSAADACDNAVTKACNAIAGQLCSNGCTPGTCDADPNGVHTYASCLNEATFDQSDHKWHTFSGVSVIQPCTKCSSPDDACNCRIDLSILNNTVTPGEALKFTLRIEHNRPVSVTVPLYIQIVNLEGEIVYQKSTEEEYTFNPGDVFSIDKNIALPPTINSGLYFLSVGVGKMKQGSIKHSKMFQII